MPENSRGDHGRGRQALRLGMPKRGYSRLEGAEYIGVGTTKFDQMVADGRMPTPKHVDGRKVWDLHRLDKFFDALPDDNEDDDVWDTVE